MAHVAAVRQAPPERFAQASQNGKNAVLANHHYTRIIITAVSDIACKACYVILAHFSVNNFGIGNLII